LVMGVTWEEELRKGNRGEGDSGIYSDSYSRNERTSISNFGRKKRDSQRRGGATEKVGVRRGSIFPACPKALSRN